MPWASAPEAGAIVATAGVVDAAAVVIFRGPTLVGLPPRPRRLVVTTLDADARAGSNALGEPNDGPCRREYRPGAVGVGAGTSGSRALVVLPPAGVMGDLTGQVFDLAAESGLHREGAVQRVAVVVDAGFEFATARA